jgi:hypothetical protein
MHVIIDGDPLIYRAGYSAERKVLWAVVRSEEGFAEYRFEPNAEDTANAQLDQLLVDNPKWMLADKWYEVVPEPVQNALQIVKAIIGSVVDAVVAKFGVDQPRVSVMLSGPDNFREKLATIRPYKGNRDPDAKPYHYQAIRDYLSQRWGATVVHGREADDECSILAWQDRKAKRSYVVVSLDKDLDQIPGWHADVRNRTFYKVSPDDADMYFWQQVLSGDPTDNIQGVPGIGPKKARNIIEAQHDSGYSDDQRWREIVKYFGDEAAALETARLVYLQREPNELWTPPGEPKQYLEESLDD